MPTDPPNQPEPDDPPLTPNEAALIGKPAVMRLDEIDELLRRSDVPVSRTLPSSAGTLAMPTDALNGRVASRVWRMVRTATTMTALLLCVAWAFSWHGAWYQRLKLPYADVLSIEQGVLWWYRTDIRSAAAMPAFPTLHSWEIGRFPVFGLLDAPWLVPTRVAVPSMRVYAIPFHALTLLAWTWLVWRGSINLRRRAAPKRGTCPTCGYDLRASKETCPECGTPVVRKPR